MLSNRLDSTLGGNPDEVLAFLHTLLESSTDYSIIVKGLDGTILLWNEGARRLYGYEAEEIVGRASADILHTPEDISTGFPDEIRMIALHEGKWEGTVERVRKNGERFTARVVLTRRSDALGQANGFLQISRDVTEEIRLTEQLKSTQLYTRSLFEANMDALMTIDLQGTITDVNQQMEALTAHSRAELIGSAFKWYFTDPTRAEEGIGLVLHEGRVTNYELTVRGKDMHETVVSYNASTFRDASNRLQGVFAAARDVTERIQFEQALHEKNLELESANMAKDGFLASMSHELRTPLNAIIGFTGTLLMRLPGPLTSEQDRQLKTVQTSARHLLSLINDLLDLAKIESGTLRASLEQVSARAVVEEVATVLRPLADNKGLGFKIAMPKTDIMLLTDRRALSQILLNLANNAIKFTEAGTVRIELEQRRDNAHAVTEFRITDTGVGILPQDQAKLFQAFSQVRVATIRHQQGTGLGLHVSEQLARLIGGEIACHSEYGKGSRFTLSLRTG